MGKSSLTNLRAATDRRGVHRGEGVREDQDGAGGCRHHRLIIIVVDPDWQPRAGAITRAVAGASQTTGPFRVGPVGHGCERYQ